MKFPVLASVASLASFQASALTLWPTSDEGTRRNLEGRRLTNPRLSSVSSAHFFSTDREIYENVDVDSFIDFGIPDREGTLHHKSCTLKKGVPGVPEALAAKFEETIGLFHCLTAENEELSLVIDRTKPSGLHATFLSNNRRAVYVDSAQENTYNYIIYDSETALKEGIPPTFVENMTLLEELGEDLSLFEPEEKVSSNTYSAFRYKLAPLTNGLYSNFHGNTKASVMAELINCLARVNGVYAHDLGLVFEFIDDADLGICLQGDSRDACDRVSNSPRVIDVSMGILTDLGVPSSSYDIGHVFTTGSGGVAYLRSLCDSRLKAGGTTGLPQPFTDVFYIDYVAHEIGHQLNGGHIFRDCNGFFDGNLMRSSAAEPGSGSSIMGYAGICGRNNLQSNSDPYFNSLNVEQMRDFIDSVSGTNACGVTLFTQPKMPAVSAPSRCEIPVGNYFQLQGTSTTSTATGAYAWDRVDARYEDYSSSTLGNYRSFKPTVSKKRFFPNLHALNFPQEDSFLWEQLPTSPRDVTFRFVERELYSSPATVEEYSDTVIGDVTYSDTTLSFVSTGALKIVSPSQQTLWGVGERVTVSWSGLSRGNAQTVSVLIADNTMTPSGSNGFDYEVDVKDLEWVTVATALSTAGGVTFTVPSGFNSNVNLMIKASFSADEDACFFFDLFTDLTIAENLVVPTEENSSEDNKGGAIAGAAIFGLVVGAIAAYVWKTKFAKNQTPITSQTFTEISPEVKIKPTKAVATRNLMFSEEHV